MTQVVHPPIATRATTSANPDHAHFGGITGHPSAGPPAGGAPDFVAIQAGPAFTVLRRRFRRFVFPMAALFFLWYLTYVLLAAFARDLMSHRVVGSVNVGLLLGLLQFVSTIAVTAAYVRHARTALDPLAAEIRSAAGARG